MTVARTMTPEMQGRTAFDVWLQIGLQDLLPDVMREPVPDTLLRLLDGQDRDE